MRFRLAGLLGVGAVLLAGALPVRADSVADFYKGKTVTLIVGYTSGGGYDIYARVLANHMGRHIPGNPTIIVQNMSGAGSLKATNYLYNVALKDGTVFATVGRGQAMEPLIGTSNTKYDATKFTWLGSGTDELSVCALMNTSPVKTWADVTKKPFTVAGEGSGSDPDTFAKMVKSLFGAKLRLISGYPGGAEMTLAIERGEVDGRCGWSWTSIKSTRPQWIKDKKLNVLAVLSLKRSEELPDVPSIFELATTDHQRQIIKLLVSRQLMGRPFVAPPNLPADRAAALRKAFMDTMKDPAFIAEANKRTMEVDPVSGEDIDKLLKEIYSSPKDIVEETKAIIASESK